jgi:hypothetical protein
LNKENVKQVLEDLQEKANNLKKELKNKVNDVNEKLDLQTKLNEIVAKIQETKDKILKK